MIRCPVLVERDTQLARFDEVLAELPTRGRALVVVGDAGIGKSRLVRDFTATAEATGLVSVTCRAVPTGVPVPLRALVELAMSLSGRGLLPEPADLGAYAAPLTRIVPEWANGQPLHAEASTPPVLGEALLRLLQKALPGGCLLVVEDVHWADPETLAVIEYLCDHRGSLLVVLTTRWNEDSAARLMVQRVAQRGGAELMELPPLSPSGVDAMVRLCGASPAEGRLVEPAEGVPLLVEELLSGSQVGHLPRSFADCVEHQLAELEPGIRTILTAAALCGRQVDWRLVDEALGVGQGRVQEALSCGVRAGLLELRSGTFRFRHALTRDAVRASSAGPVLARLAAALLAAVLRRGPDLPEQTCALAADLAVEAGDETRAVALLGTAATRARQDGAVGSAAAMLDRALGLHPPASVRADLLEALLDCHCRAGRVDDAVQVNRQLLSTVRGTSAEGEVRARAHLRLARLSASRNEWDVAETELSLAGVPESSPAAAEAALVDAMIKFGRRSYPEAERLARELAVSALADGQPEVACAAEEVVGRVARLHDPASALQAFSRAHTIAVQHGLALAELSALHELGTIDMFTSGRLDRLLEARRRAMTAGAALTVALINLQLVPAFYMHGDAEHARAAALDSIDGAIGVGSEDIRARVTSFLPHTSALRGDRAAVEVDIAALLTTDLARDADAESGIWGTARGVCSLLLEDRAAAVDAFERAARAARSATDISPHTWWGFWALLRAVEGGDAEHAIRALRASPAIVNQQNAMMAQLAEAVLLGRAGQRARATQIVESFGPREFPWAWQRQLARRLVAEAALRDGWGRPVAWLDEAAAFYDGFAVRDVATRARRLVGHLRSAGPVRAGADRVTPRERQVLDMLGNGLTNLQLARRLAISPRTVEKHVAALCRKLGADGRGQLIALSVRGR